MRSGGFQQHLAEAVDGDERRAQVVRPRVQKRIELLGHHLQLDGALFDAPFEIANWRGFTGTLDDLPQLGDIRLRDVRRAAVQRGLTGADDDERRVRSAHLRGDEGRATVVAGQAAVGQDDVEALLLQRQRYSWDVVTACSSKSSPCRMRL